MTVLTGGECYWGATGMFHKIAGLPRFSNRPEISNIFIEQEVVPCEYPEINYYQAGQFRGFQDSYCNSVFQYSQLFPTFFRFFSHYYVLFWLLIFIENISYC